MEVVFATDIKVLEATLYHPFGGITIEHHHTLGERTVVDPDTYGTLQHLGTLDKGTEAFAYLIVHGAVHFVIPFGHALVVDVVPRIDAYLLDILQRCIRSGRVEVNICYQRSHDTAST